MAKMVKLQNVKNPKIVIEVKDNVAGTFVGTKEWIVLEEKTKENSFEFNKNEK